MTALVMVDILNWHRRNMQQVDFLALTGALDVLNPMNVVVEKDGTICHIGPTAKRFQPDAGVGFLKPSLLRSRRM